MKVAEGSLNVWKYYCEQKRTKTHEKVFGWVVLCSNMV